jgi:hypothetical protein
MENQLNTITPGNYTVQVNYVPFTNDQFFDIISGVVLQNVDQFSPFESVVTSSYNGGAAAVNFTSPVTCGIGGAFVTAIFSGNPPSSGATNGSTNNWTINSGFTEGTDVYRANTAVAPTTGGCLQTAFKLGAAGGTENPTFTFNGTPNRRLLFGLGLRKATAVDNVVQLRKTTGSVGSNYANTTALWPLVDTYTTYGGPIDMWGTTWSNVDVNSPGFGATLKANILNGSIDVDNMRITIYTVNILPVELIDFQAIRIDDRTVNCMWYTATEYNTSHFVIERSIDGVNFEPIGTESAVGTSQSTLSYNFVDMLAPQNELYYRLKMVDFDGQFEYSDVRAVLQSNDMSNIYPNPVNNWVSVLTHGNNETITITTSDGRIIDQAHGTSFEDTHHFNLSYEPDGVYFIIINSESGQEVKKLTKMSK